MLKRIYNNELIKVFSFTSLSSAIKILTNFVSIKVIATLIGPIGIALIGQLQNVISIFNTLGSGGINNGVVKYVAEHKNNSIKLQQFIANALGFTVYLSVFFGMILLLFSKTLSECLLYDKQYYYVFAIYGVSLLFLSLNNFLLSVINGFKDFKKFVIINIVTSLVGLVFTLILVFQYKIYGALIALVTYQSVVLVITAFSVKNAHWYHKEFFKLQFDGIVLKKYLHYSLMALVTAITVPVAQLIIRNIIVSQYSITEAGFWESMNRISGVYLMFIINSFSVYYLPKLSETHTLTDLKNEVFKTYKIILPVLILMLLSIYALRNIIIKILFTDDFFVIKKYFFWQLTGDFFKITSWVLAFIMVAKSQTKLFVVTEILFSLTLIFLSKYFIELHGVQGAIQAYALNYFIYFLLMIVIYRKMIFKKSVVNA